MANQNEDRFVLVYKQEKEPFTKVFVDRATGVQYLSDQVFHGNGLTILVDQNGKPLLYSPDQYVAK